MVDLVDKGEAELQQLTQKVTMSTTSASMKASLWVGKGVAAWPFKAVTAIFNAVTQELTKGRETGQISLKNFSRIAEGKRELLNIDDAKVSRELERELSRHGVVWSVEPHRDGSRTFHVQGKDAELIQHALTVAAERVDEKLARQAPELQRDTAQQQTAQQTEAQQQGSVAPMHGTDELREDAPRVESAEQSQTRTGDESHAPERVSGQSDEAVTDRGGHSIEQQPALSRSEQRPEQTARDRTRAHASDKIDRNVKQRKAEIDTKKTRTQKRTPSRAAADEGRAPNAGRR